MGAPVTTAVSGSTRPLEVRRLGRVPAGEAVELQKQLVEERRTGVIPDTLLLLEHPHVITRGVKARQVTANLRVSKPSCPRVRSSCATPAAAATSPITARDNWSAIRSSTCARIAATSTPTSTTSKR